MWPITKGRMGLIDLGVANLWRQNGVKGHMSQEGPGCGQYGVKRLSRQKGPGYGQNGVNRHEPPGCGLSLEAEWV